MHTGCIARGDAVERGQVILAYAVKISSSRNLDRFMKNDSECELMSCESPQRVPQIHSWHAFTDDQHAAMKIVSPQNARKVYSALAYSDPKISPIRRLGRTSKVFSSSHISGSSLTKHKIFGWGHACPDEPGAAGEDRRVVHTGLQDCAGSSRKSLLSACRYTSTLPPRLQRISSHDKRTVSPRPVYSGRRSFIRM